MKIRIRELRKIIREVILKEKKKNIWGGSVPEESYEEDLLSDPAYHAKSVYVPDEIKEKIKLKLIEKYGVDHPMRCENIF